ncbi:MAG: cobalamin B12-binding domain-containing protein [Candidatus Tectomicrobia bacterium]|uniref:Cobalamin B12-binding domain-containing protein n=1 Tax=Tectimicrobiota bacterium TaxID=2528274 RepID=A0A932CQQ0_UNCTE|nr:cobalamin B12-binding domain-containing protein [Candidatus Tectomicrobia bacterium]
MPFSILLVQTNRERLPQPVIPLGLGLVAAATAQAGHQVKVLDLCFSKDPERELAERLRRRAYDVVGLSIRNLDSSDALRPHSYLEEVRALVRTVRRVTPVPLIIGGAAVSIAPAAMAEYLGADHALTGAGEYALPALLKQWGNGGPRPRRVFSGEDPPTGASALPPAAGHTALALGRYLVRHRWLPVQTKRGCSFGCIYCTYSRIEGSVPRCRSAESVVDELKALRSRFRVNSFELVDSTWNHPVEHAKEICEAILSAGLRPNLQSLTLHAGSCDGELLRLMVRAGFCGVGCSPDSASDRMLDQLGKGLGSDQLARTIDAVHQASLPGLWFFLLGGPGETEETVAETFRFIRKRLRRRRDIVMITCGLRIYPGTELERRARAEGLLDASHNLLEPVFYFSPGLRRERLRELLRQQADDRWILMADTHLRAIEPFRRLHALLRLRKPFWAYAGMVGRWLRSSKALGNDAAWG